MPARRADAARQSEPLDAQLQLLMSVGAGALRLAGGRGPCAIAAGCLITSAYGFVFAMIGGAAVGVRGHSPVLLGRNTACFAGHLVGAVGSIAGLAMVAWAVLG